MNATSIMPVTRALLTAVFIDLVNNEKAACDEWISTKAIKALIEYRYNLQELNQRMVTMAVKAAVEQHKDAYWDCHLYNFVSSRLGWVWGESSGDLCVLSIGISVPVFCVGAGTACFSHESKSTRGSKFQIPSQNKNRKIDPQGHPFTW